MDIENNEKVLEIQNYKNKFKGEKIPKILDNIKSQELKALEIYAASKSTENKNFNFPNILSGNEDAAQIYAYVEFSPTKHSYRELLKFRRRANYFEYMVQLIEKALNEEFTSTKDVNEIFIETFEWMKKRNASLLGVQLNVYKKPNLIAITGNAEKQVFQCLFNETEKSKISNGEMKSNKPKINQRGILKKYKLLIPLDLDLQEKLKVLYRLN